MKSTPILFSAPMVRALLAGTKSQTRRGIKPQPDLVTNEIVARFTPNDQKLGRLGEVVNCPYGQVGDQLWVRETWQPHPEAGMDYPGQNIQSDCVCYAADFNEHEVSDSKPWKPSIHMPRWASRIQLEITGIRVERLQDIIEDDALAEGITYRDLPDNPDDTTKARTWYRGLWSTINGFDSWEQNPYVWVIEFKVIKNG